jgi:predicted transcriptional regulator
MNAIPNLEPSPRPTLGGETAADLMTPNPVSLNADMTVTEAAAFFTDMGVSAAPVIDEAGRPIGVLSQSDIVMHERANLPGEPDHPESTRSDRGPVPVIRTDLDMFDADYTQVSEIMTPLVFVVAPETPAHRVIEEMLTRKVHRLFVVGSDGVLIGVISTIDVLRHLHWEAPGKSTRVPSAPRGGS